MVRSRVGDPEPLAVVADLDTAEVEARGSEHVDDRERMVDGGAV